MDQKTEQKGLYSRRAFVKAVPLGFAAAFVVSVVSGKILARLRQGPQPPVVREGSIFTPRGGRAPKA